MREENNCRFNQGCEIWKKYKKLFLIVRKIKDGKMSLDVGQ